MMRVWRYDEYTGPAASTASVSPRGLHLMLVEFLMRNPGPTDSVLVPVPQLAVYAAGARPLAVRLEVGPGVTVTGSRRYDSAAESYFYWPPGRRGRGSVVLTRSTPPRAPGRAAGAARSRVRRLVTVTSDSDASALPVLTGISPPARRRRPAQSD